MGGGGRLLCVRVVVGCAGGRFGVLGWVTGVGARLGGAAGGVAAVGLLLVLWVPAGGRGGVVGLLPRRRVGGGLGCAVVIVT